MIHTKEKKMKFKSKKLNDGHEHDEEMAPEEPKMIMFSGGPESRVLGLFGEVEENKVAQIIGMMMELSETPAESDDDEDEGSEVSKEGEEPKEGEEAKEVVPTEIPPIEFLLSTPGGSADDMFALYDIMRVVRERCTIQTFGLGKVMSAGVLLLAAGTKGQRKIGKNCRVMIHSVIGGTSGSFHNLENEMEEMRYMQEAYLKALSDESSLSVAQLKRMINRKVNVYLSAEEAVKMGIADIIV
jgi:ATP-dependent Clp endopeptidase proteolytic subunit ClpP